MVNTTEVPHRLPSQAVPPRASTSRRAPVPRACGASRVRAARATRERASAALRRPTTPASPRRVPAGRPLPFSRRRSPRAWGAPGGRHAHRGGDEARGGERGARPEVRHPSLRHRDPRVPTPSRAHAARAAAWRPTRTSRWRRRCGASRPRASTSCRRRWRCCARTCLGQRPSTCRRSAAPPRPRCWAARRRRCGALPRCFRTSAWGMTAKGGR